MENPQCTYKEGDIIYVYNDDLILICELVYIGFEHVSHSVILIHCSLRATHQKVLLHVLNFLNKQIMDE